MLKFFRKIRQNLLSEGKTGRYLKYAIGEIVLVVVGILIAVNINNWNQGIQEGKELTKYLKAISKNISQDLVSTTNMMAHREEAKNAVRGVLDELHAGNGMTISDSLMLQAFSFVFVEKFLRFNESGLEALKSSGYLRKLSETPLEAALYDYYEMVEQIKGAEISLNEYVEAMEIDISKRSIASEVVKSYLFPDARRTTPLSSTLQDPGVKAAFYRIASVQTLRHRYYPELVARGERFIELTAALN